MQRLAHRPPGRAPGSSEEPSAPGVPLLTCFTSAQPSLRGLPSEAALPGNKSRASVPPSSTCTSSASQHSSPGRLSPGPGLALPAASTGPRLLLSLNMESRLFFLTLSLEPGSRAHGPTPRPVDEQRALVGGRESGRPPQPPGAAASPRASSPPCAHGHVCQGLQLLTSWKLEFPEP